MAAITRERQISAALRAIAAFGEPPKCWVLIRKISSARGDHGPAQFCDRFQAHQSLQMLTLLRTPHDACWQVETTMERVKLRSTESKLPRISEFFGMIVYMYWLDTQKHKLPHFHVRYQGAEAVFALNGQVIEGNLGARAHRLLQDWASERADEVQHAWQCAASGKEIPWVLPIQ